MLKNFLLIILLLFEESYHISFSTAREVSAFISSAALYPFGEFTPTPISLTEDRPILLIHGAGGNRATWYPLMQTLEKHQIGPLFSYNYHPKNRLSALKTALAEIRDQATEDIEVILIGHSLGAITACEYALHPEWHVPGVKIHQIIAIAGRTSPHANRLHFCFEHLISPLTLIDDQCHTLPLTCIDTDHDWLVPQCHRAEQTITIPNHSHLSLLFSQKTHHLIINTLDNKKYKDYNKKIKKDNLMNLEFSKETYISNTKRDFSNPLKPIYTIETEPDLAARVAKQILFFIPNLIHSLIGKLVVPAATPLLTKRLPNHADHYRQKIDLNTDWKYKRITLSIDGTTIDAMIVTKEDRKGNGRWLLRSNGNAETYEDLLQTEYLGEPVENQLHKLLDQTHSNALLFNYPGVGGSSSLPNRQTMIKAYEVALRFLEDKIEAKEIISWGNSIGSAVQAEAFQTHKAKENTKYTFVYQHPFTAIENVVHPALGFALKLLGWNFSTPLAKNRKHIMIQAAKMNSPAEITDEKILHDGVIPPEAALAAKKPADVILLGMPPVKDPETGKPLTHNARLSDPLLTLITNQINASF